MSDSYLIKVLQYLSDRDGEFIKASDILVALNVSDENCKISDAIENKLYQQKLVFATEESGIMINENGKTFLLEHQLSYKQNNKLSVKVRRFFSNIWTVAIIGGLLVAIIAAFIIYKLRWTQ